ncbi:MAG TPA: HEAT repeat domain-containing protein, partial [bacterium]|nr:HEAT repeat domain-containing protein [bacterium]
MDKIKNFYNGLNKKNRIIFWITVVIILFSFFSIGKTIHRSTTSKNPKIETYLKQIKSKDIKKREIGVYTVGLYKIKEMADTMENLIKNDPEDNIRRLAAWSLGRIDINRLINLLDSKDKDIKTIAMDALIKLDKNNVSYM